MLPSFPRYGRASVQPPFTAPLGCVPFGLGGVSRVVCVGECARGSSAEGFGGLTLGRAEAGLAGGGFVSVISSLGAGVGGVSE